MKKCMYCAEQIQDEALKCRFCGEFLPEYDNFLEEKKIEEKKLQESKQKEELTRQQKIFESNIRNKYIDNFYSRSSIYRNFNRLEISVESRFDKTDSVTVPNGIIDIILEHFGLNHYTVGFPFDLENIFMNILNSKEISIFFDHYGRVKKIDCLSDIGNKEWEFKYSQFEFFPNVSIIYNFSHHKPSKDLHYGSTTITMMSNEIFTEKNQLFIQKGQLPNGFTLKYQEEIEKDKIITLHDVRDMGGNSIFCDYYKTNSLNKIEYDHNSKKVKYIESSDGNHLSFTYNEKCEPISIVGSNFDEKFEYDGDCCTKNTKLQSALDSYSRKYFINGGYGSKLSSIWYEGRKKSMLGYKLEEEKMIHFSYF